MPLAASSTVSVSVTPPFTHTCSTLAPLDLLLRSAPPESGLALLPRLVRHFRYDVWGPYVWEQGAFQGAWIPLESFAPFFFAECFEVGFLNLKMGTPKPPRVSSLSLFERCAIFFNLFSFFDMNFFLLKALCQYLLQYGPPFVKKICVPPPPRLCPQKTDQS